MTVPTDQKQLAILEHWAGNGLKLKGVHFLGTFYF